MDVWLWYRAMYIVRHGILSRQQFENKLSRLQVFSFWLDLARLELTNEGCSLGYAAVLYTGYFLQWNE